MSCGGASSIPGPGEPQRDPAAAAAAAAPLELPVAEESAGLRRLQPQEKPAADDPPGAGQSSGSGGTPPGPSEGRRGGSERARGEAGAVGGDKPETRSVCGSDSGSDSNPGGAGPICKICFQGAEQGELLNPCRCDGSVRYTHQLCLLKWISERGSWTCELCCYRYHVIAIKMKKPCQLLPTDWIVYVASSMEQLSMRLPGDAEAEHGFFCNYSSQLTRAL